MILGEKKKNTIEREERNEREERVSHKDIIIITDDIDRRNFRDRKASSIECEEREREREREQCKIDRKRSLMKNFDDLVDSLRISKLFVFFFLFVIVGTNYGLVILETW
ncbi:hypothetical protein SSS_09852 [Sarcoptes scabiei]|nr:hypothetical protein SSS_09852 [Sarcoptes scabiei]